MQTIDLALQKSVWARVLGTSPVRTEDEPPERALLRFLEGEREGFETYRRLSRRLWGRDAALLRGLAAESLTRYQTLHAAYYAETGRRAGLPSPKQSNLPSLPEALVSARNREKKTARAYEEAAKRWPSLSEDFLALAGAERRRVRCLQTLLGRLL